MFIIIVKAPTPFFYDGYTKQTTMDISAISELVMVMEIQGKHIDSGYLQRFPLYWKMFLSTAQMRKGSKPQHDIHLAIFNEDVYCLRHRIHVRPTSVGTKREFSARLEEVMQMPGKITECGFEFPPAGCEYFCCAHNSCLEEIERV